MLMKRLFIGAAIWGSIVGVAGAQAVETTAAPPPIPIDGVMTDAGGHPLTGLVSVIFALYEEPANGVPLWVEIQVVHADAAGRYTALLGATTELNVDLFAQGAARWLGIQPDGQPEQPRVRFLSVPYALKAVDMDTIGGQPLSALVLSLDLDERLTGADLGAVRSGLAGGSLV